MTPTYPNTPQITVDALLKQPELISRALTNLVYKRLIADRLFLRGSSEQVAGGVVRYQRSESIFTTRDVEEVATRGSFPRTGWSEDVLTEIVHTYGLEVPINDLVVRRSQLDYVIRAQRKIANNLVRFIDGKAMTLLTTDPAVQTRSALGDWTTANTDIILDIATAQKLIEDQDEGYEPSTLVINPAQLLDLRADADIRAALPREAMANVTRDTSGILRLAAPLLGLQQILVTPRLAAGTHIVMDAGVAGTIADETPDPTEGYVSYDPGPGFAPIYVKVYREENHSDRVVRGARWPAMWLAEPKAVVVSTGA